MTRDETLDNLIDLARQCRTELENINRIWGEIMTRARDGFGEG